MQLSIIHNTEGSLYLKLLCVQGQYVVTLLLATTGDPSLPTKGYHNGITWSLPLFKVAIVSDNKGVKF